MIKKIVKKGSVFWKHGKHKGLTGYLVAKNREKKNRPSEMHGSVRDLMGAEKLRHRKPSPRPSRR